MSPKPQARLRLAVSPPVFFVSSGALVAFVTFGVFFTETAAVVFDEVKRVAVGGFSSVYVTSITAFFLFVVWLLFSRYADLRLGADDERPEFSTLSWFSMLFSAGMGIGLVFYGVGEPMYHFASPPVGDGGSAAAAAKALQRTFFHWGFHVWAAYALMALGIAYFAFRRRLPLAIRSCFYPLLGERIYRWPGHLIDILAVIGTLFGLATSLGLGAKQVNAGLHRVFGVPQGEGPQLILILVITLAATVSLVTGVKKGIRRLSELNIVLASLLLFFVFVLGPTRFIVEAFLDGFAGYLGDFVPRSLRLSAVVRDSAGGYLLPDGVSEQENEWIVSWTIFYWGWWISWVPFVGMFVARISRGRTIREFILAVMLVPPLVTFFWMSVFGGAALSLELTPDLEPGLADAVLAGGDQFATAIYLLLDHYPLSAVTSFLTAAVVAVFFVTSSDSASFVVDMLTSGGHPDPPVWQRVFWAIAEGATAAVLLYVGGPEALSALQAGVISTGLPFCVVLVLLMFSLTKALRDDPALRGIPVLRGQSGEEEGSPGSPTHLPPLERPPVKLERILVPVDLSEHSARAVRHAVQLSHFGESDRGVVDLVHVAPPPVEYLPLDEWIWGEARTQRDVEEELAKVARQALEDFAAALPKDMRGAIGEKHLRLGVPSETILEVAKEGNYDAVVMGTHGRTGAERKLLGSVTQRVLRFSPCPVVTVN